MDDTNDVFQRVVIQMTILLLLKTAKTIVTFYTSG